MKILITGQKHYNHVTSVVKSCQQLGHEIAFVNMVDFYFQCNYAERKLYKLGMKFLEDHYNKHWKEKFIATCKQFNPDTILAVNGNMLDIPTLKWVRSLKIKLILWLFDGRKRLAEYENNMVYYDKIYCFEEDDVAYFKEKYKMNVQYCPVGFESDMYFPDDTAIRDIDISFVGNPSEKRLEILREIAKHVCQESLTMQIYGLWWDKKYFWKKLIFKNKNKPLGKYINNFELGAADVATIYRRSKICLNINVAEHSGYNPRTFEILATKSFQLMDDRKNVNTHIVRPGIDLITYHNADDLLNKIDYYLSHENERNQIAANGYNRIKDKFAMTQMVKSIIG